MTWQGIWVKKEGDYLTRLAANEGMFLSVGESISSMDSRRLTFQSKLFSELDEGQS